MYTVVVCSRCHFVWIVKDRPKTSQCPKCHRRRQVKKLKKYYRGEDKEAARLARAHAQAKVDDQEELFENALERGALEQEIYGIISDSDYLEGKGVDSTAIDKYVDQLLTSPGTSRSHRMLIEDELREEDTVDLDEILSAIEEQGWSPEETILKLEKLVRSGNIEPPRNISLSDIQSKSNELIEKTEDASNEAEEVTPDRPNTSRQGVIKQACEDHPSGPLSKILEYGKARGISSDTFILHLEKLIRSGQVELDVPVASVEEKANELLSLQDDGEVQSNGEFDNSSSSRRGVIENAVDDLDAPTIDDVVDYASKHGVSEKQALSALEKSLQSGIVRGEPRLDISLVRERRQDSSRDGNTEGMASEENDSLSSLNQRELILKSVEDNDSPTRSDVLDFATSNGMSRDKAESILDKLIHHGEISRKPDQTLKLI